MHERPYDGPALRAHPVAHGRPPTPDGDRVPQLPRAPAPARWPGVVIAAVVLVLTVAGIAGWWQR
ncbi:hypothetical protein AB0B27_13860 [Micromonospora rifamycinica]|uniref:hypothetical protein n=1 Tax=Micromonospora rifamycinica TaxID=291594 RepID=UPI00340B5CFA